jgi:hypothetical protein
MTIVSSMSGVGTEVIMSPTIIDHSEEIAAEAAERFSSLLS